MSEQEKLRPCPFCGQHLITRSKDPYAGSFEHPLGPCWRDGSLFCPADEEQWNNAYCWRLLDEKDKRINELQEYAVSVERKRDELYDKSILLRSASGTMLGEGDAL